MFEKIIGLIIGLSDKITPPIERVKHPAIDPKGELSDAHGVELFLARDGHTMHRLDFRGPRREHMIGDIESLIRYCRRHGEENKTTLFCSERSFVLILDDEERPDIDHATMMLKPSTALKAWNQIAGNGAFGQVNFRDLIEDRAEDLCEQKLAVQLARFKRTSTVEYNSDLTDGANIVFQVKEKDRGGKAMLPRRFDIEIPLFEGWPQKYKISLALKTGGKTGEPPTFSCSFRDIEDARALAIQDMVNHCDVTLNGKAKKGSWLVVCGSPSATRPLSERIDPTRG